MDNQQKDPYFCTCGPCKRFWQETFRSEAACLTRHNDERADSTATLSKQNPDMTVAIGDRVSVHGKPGTVKFVGFVDENVIAPTLRVGIKLDEPVLAGNDGLLNGKRYFYCTNGHGILVRYRDVKPVAAVNKRPPVHGNPMFPSWPQICKRRKKREAMIEEAHRKSMATYSPGQSAKTPRPPAISPRLNRAQELRRERTIMPQLPGAMRVLSNDPNDMYNKDKLEKKRRQETQPTRTAGPSVPLSWEKVMMQKWRRKYKDPDKANRMCDTLIKLQSAYQEGIHLREHNREHHYRHITAE